MFGSLAAQRPITSGARSFLPFTLPGAFHSPRCLSLSAVPFALPSAFRSPSRPLPFVLRLPPISGPGGIVEEL